MKYIMPKGFHDGFSAIRNYYDSFRDCLEKGKAYIDYDRKVKEFAGETGPIRRGIGMAAFWYNTAVYPISLETSSNRMLLNLDGTVTMQCGETEIGQGADTAYAQMTAEAIGFQATATCTLSPARIPTLRPRVLALMQAARPMLQASPSARRAALCARRSSLTRQKLTRQEWSNMDIIDGNIVRVMDGAVLMSLKELAMTAQYNAADSEHITAESTLPSATTPIPSAAALPRSRSISRCARSSSCGSSTSTTAASSSTPRLQRRRSTAVCRWPSATDCSSSCCSMKRPASPQQQSARLQALDDHGSPGTWRLCLWKTPSRPRRSARRRSANRPPAPARLPSATPFCRPPASPSTKRPSRRMFCSQSLPKRALFTTETGRKGGKVSHV